MTTASGGVAVIATQLAQTDRRALSEAWYSALHLARDAQPQRTRAGRAAHAAGEAAFAAPRISAATVHSPSAPSTPGRARRDERGAALPANERRLPPSETARRIERALATLAAPGARPAAHTIEISGGRVRLLVHHDGRTTRVVALCSGALREQVERALASARFALAGAGVAVAAP